MGMFDSIFGGGGDIDFPDIDDYGPMLQYQADLNRLNQTTPFGSITYTKDGPQAAPRNERTRRKDSTYGTGLTETQDIMNARPGRFTSNSNNTDYGGGSTSVGFEFSPELQTMFDKQFDPNAYDNYKNDYMGNYTDLMAPMRGDQLDRFQQNMFNRGQPEGGDLYGDVYRDTIGDPNARQDLMAATQAQGASDNARLNDFNRLMAAMGGSQINYPGVDVMGAANLAGNINMQNQANESSIWDTLPTLASAYMIGAPGDSWLWG